MNTSNPPTLSGVLEHSRGRFTFPPTPLPWGGIRTIVKIHESLRLTALNRSISRTQRGGPPWATPKLPTSFFDNLALDEPMGIKSSNPEPLGVQTFEPWATWGPNVEKTPLSGPLSRKNSAIRTS